MADKSKIEWTQGPDGTPGATWNPVTGCTKVSPGCDHCYAETFAERWRGTPGHYFENGFDVTLRPDKLDQPLRWKRPRRIFVNSMSDLFHESVPDGFIGSVFDVMAKTPRHTYQILTKRHGRMRSLLNKWAADDWTWRRYDSLWCGPVKGPLPNVWLGVSVEDQKWADIRIPALLDTPAAVRFISAEPLLGPVNLAPWLPAAKGCFCETHWSWMCGGDINGGECRRTRLSWVIAGGESGPGARPLEEDWIRAMVWQCRTTRVPAFVKQLGKSLGRDLGAGPKGGDWDAWPEDLRVREFPAPVATREAA
jgi:protein gp37